MCSDSKMKFIGLNFVLFFLSISSFAQKNVSHFKTEIDFGGGTVISTFLDAKIAKNEFTITSPKNADVRMMGFKARIGRVIGKAPKKGIIVSIKGTQKADSLFGETAIPMFGKLKFKGVLKNNALSGEFLNDEGVSIGVLEGVGTTENKIDYASLYPELIKTIKENIYSTSVLQTKRWKKFEKKLGKLSKVAHDDIELFFGFSMLAQQLPFTHLNLLIAAEESEQSEGEEEQPEIVNKSVIFEAKNDSTAYLQIKNFSTSAEELAAVLPEIVNNKAYTNLIIDLRNNGGGGVGPAFELAKYIITEDTEVGYFPTNKLTYSGYQPELFKTLPEMQPKSTDELGDELKTSPGVKLIFKKPANPVFSGKIYILTNHYTGSTCEPMVYAMKNRKKATIVGEKTYGGMLAASPFYVQGKYLLMLPIADFYTYDGVRLDKVGVMPDVEVKSEDAEAKAMELINGGK